jgi:hypothetical protein
MLAELSIIKSKLGSTPAARNGGAAAPTAQELSAVTGLIRLPAIQRIVDSSVIICFHEYFIILIPFPVFSIETQKKTR